MHQTERTPRTYRHRGYVIEALPCGPHRWNIWRPRADLALCGVQSLAEAREVLAAIDRGLICAVFSLKCACSAPFRAFFSMAWSSCSGLLFAEIRCTAALFPVFQPAAALFCFNPRDPLRLLGLPFLAGPSPAPRGRPQTPLFAENRCAAAFFPFFGRPRPLIRSFR